MRLIYLDDSKQDKNKQRFQVIGAIIVHDAHFIYLEQVLGYWFYEMVAPLATGKFEEFHATDLLSGNPPFEKVSRKQALEIFSQALTNVIDLKIPIIYGAVDLNKLYATNYATAKPVDMAFRICIKLIEEWFEEKAPNEFGLLIADDAEKSIKHEMSNAFHLFRRKVVSSPPVRGDLPHLHDDMYFGESKHSIGIQLADLCMLLVSRHLAGYSDTEDLFLQLKENIYKGVVEPV